MNRSIFSLEWCSRALVAGILADKQDLDGDWRRGTSAYLRVGLDIKACRS